MKLRQSGTLLLTGHPGLFLGAYAVGMPRRKPGRRVGRGGAQNTTPSTAGWVDPVMVLVDIPKGGPA